MKVGFGMVEDRIKTIYTSESLYNALSEEEKMNPNVVYWIDPGQPVDCYACNCGAYNNGCVTL